MTAPPSVCLHGLCGFLIPSTNLLPLSSLANDIPSMTLTSSARVPTLWFRRSYLPFGVKSPYARCKVDCRSCRSQIWFPRQYNSINQFPFGVLSSPPSFQQIRHIIRPASVLHFCSTLVSLLSNFCSRATYALPSLSACTHRTGLSHPLQSHGEMLFTYIFQFAFELIRSSRLEKMVVQRLDMRT